MNRGARRCSPRDQHHSVASGSAPYSEDHASAVTQDGDNAAAAYSSSIDCWNGDTRSVRGSGVTAVEAVNLAPMWCV